MAFDITPSRYSPAGIVGLCVLVLAMAAHSGAVTAQEATTPDAVIEDLLITERLLEGEQNTSAAVREALIARQDRGDQRPISVDQLTALSVREAALRGLEANLDVARGSIGRDIASEVLREAEAVFRPTLSVSFNYDRSATQDRTERDNRYKQATTVIIDDNGNPHDAVTFEEGIITYLGFDQPRQAGQGPTTIRASQKGLTDPQESLSYDIGISQILPWGGSFTLNQEMTYKTAEFTVNADSRLQGRARTGNYGRPWTVVTNGEVSLPFPFTRRSGRAASDENVRIELARVQQRAAGRTLDAVINDTLLAIDIAYFELVRAGITVEATLHNRAQAGALLDKSNTLFELGQTTAYHLSRVEADVARADSEVELALTNYMTASNALRRLLNEDADVVYLPQGYLATMTRSSSFSVDNLDGLNADTNPNVRFEDENVRAAEISARQAELQTRPDITFDMSVRFGQLNDTFGYDDYTESMGHMFDADFVDQNIGATFVRPWGNRNANAQHDEAVNTLNAQQLLRKSQWNTARRQIRDALVNHVSAKRRLQLAEKRLDFAQQSYTKASEQQRIRTVTEYEIIRLNQNVLEAHRSVIAAVVDTKQAEARVLAGAGMLAERYAERTAMSELELKRIAALRDAHQMNYFAEIAP